MSLSSGARLGPYEIIAAIGAGGMGEVYKARDTRLERTVAVKVLPAHLSASSESRERFEREAKTISSLSHPHICALFDVGNQDGVEFLVMEYLEGETLADRLARGALPLGQVLRHGIEIADALEKAHRQGIVHRDLKPGNVMLTKSGVKLLDFGLAKVVFPSSSPAVTALPTMTPALTQEGTILGTFQYMAPEQLEGREADSRTDIFAFGAVLYEMATDRKAFAGRSQATLISSIISSDPPDISSLAPGMPPALDRVVRTCLAKEPDDRWQTAHDIAVQLKWIQEGGATATATATAPGRPATAMRLLPWIVAALATAALLALLVRDWRRSSVRPPVSRFSILAPDKTMFTPPGELSSSQLALSPDGRTLAFIANPVGARPLLWLRALGSLTAVPLAGTEDALHPFWSPDSRSLGFFTPTTLKRVEASGGTPQRICEVVAGRGGSWNREGVILFAHSAPTPIYRVSDTGGEPETVTDLNAARGEDRHRYPVFLPDGRRFLFWSRSPGREHTGIYVASLDSREARLVLKSETLAQYSDPGYMLTVQQGMLVAYPFDEKSAQVRGTPIRVAESILTGNPPGFAPFTVAGANVLAYSSPFARSRRLVWFDRSGRKIGTVGEPGDYGTPSLSPDEKRIAVAIREESKNHTDIWLFDSVRGAWSRFTFDPASERAPLWSPDGSRIVFSSGSQGLLDLYEKPAGGSGEPRLIVRSAGDKFPTDWSRDGRYLVYHTFGGNSFWDLWVAPTDGGKPFALFSTKYTEVQGQISPDGRWIAYASDESGRFEIYVMQFPEKRGRWQISTAGGTQPWWRGDGKEVFYLGPDQTLMSVAVRVDDSFQAAVPTPLFRANFPAPIPAFWSNYVATADGQRFLVSELLPEAAATPVNVVLNWTAGLKK
ncbi:MAG: protein kinase [Acidobacteriota bacterium]|nr:protein kinase [Acidobacteriota bacterium]